MPGQYELENTIQKKYNQLINFQMHTAWPDKFCKVLSCSIFMLLTIGSICQLVSLKAILDFSFFWGQQKYIWQGKPSTILSKDILIFFLNLFCSQMLELKLAKQTIILKE